MFRLKTLTTTTTGHKYLTHRQTHSLKVLHVSGVQYSTIQSQVLQYCSLLPTLIILNKHLHNVYTWVIVIDFYYPFFATYTVACTRAPPVSSAELFDLFYNLALGAAIAYGLLVCYSKKTKQRDVTKMWNRLENGLANGPKGTCPKHSFGHRNSLTSDHTMWSKTIKPCAYIGCPKRTSFFVQLKDHFSFRTCRLYACWDIIYLGFVVWLIATTTDLQFYRWQLVSTLSFIS